MSKKFLQKYNRQAVKLDMEKILRDDERTEPAPTLYELMGEDPAEQLMREQFYLEQYEAQQAREMAEYYADLEADAYRDEMHRQECEMCQAAWENMYDFD